MILNGFPSLSVGPKYMIVCWEMSYYYSILHWCDLQYNILLEYAIKAYWEGYFTHSGVCLLYFQADRHPTFFYK